MKEKYPVSGSTSNRLLLALKAHLKHLIYNNAYINLQLNKGVRYKGFR